MILSSQFTPDLVSVVIPVYNAERYVAEAIKSVLAQSVNMEVIVIDDGSTDNSLDIAARFASPVRCLKITHAGAAWARNHGVTQAKGEFLAFLDADDLWLPEKIERQLSVLKQTVGPAAIFSHIEQFFSADLSLPANPLTSPILPGASICTMLIRRRDFDSVGHFSTAWSRGEFIDWYSRARESGMRFHMLPDVLARRRIHDGNLNRQDTQASDYAYVVKACRDRALAKRSETRDLWSRSTT